MAQSKDLSGAFLDAGNCSGHPLSLGASDAALKGVRAVAWFDSDKPLRSGWAWGQSYLEGAVAIAEAKVGRGHLYLFGPEITFRAQPHGTFKFLFNGIYGGGERPSVVP